MMVKNESRVIRRALDSVAPHVDAWFVCDTGSDDETPDIVERHMAALPGRLHRTTFLDFGRSRTETVVRARAFCLERGLDYLLLLDADEVIEILDRRWKKRLRGCPYLLLYDDPLSYRIQALVPARVPWRYVGRTHEYIEPLGPCLPAEPFDGIVLHDLADGGCKADKFDRDARLLEEALGEDPSDERAWFYLGETHLNGGLNPWRALEAYSRRARMGGFAEEAWYASYRRGACLERLPERVGGVWPAMGAWFEAWERRPWRAEPLHEIVRTCCDQGLHLLGAIVGEHAIRSVLPRPERASDILFVDRLKNGPGLLDWTSLCEHAIGEVERARRLAEEALHQPGMEIHAERVRSNLALFESTRADLDEEQAVESILAACTYLRERGLNLSCVSVADGFAGRDRFAALLEDNILPKSWRLDFERSICSYYVPGRRAEAARLTFDLARRRGLARKEREAVCRNRRFYVEPLPERVLRPIPLQVEPGAFTPGYRATNPSVARGRDGLMVLVRTVNYELQPDGSYLIPGFAETRNLMGVLRPDGRVVQTCELSVACPVPLDSGPIRGFEDARLVVPPGESGGVWALANHAHPSGNGRRAMFLLKVELGPGAAWIREALHLHGLQDRKHQKNWMPAIVEGELLLVYKCDPTVVVRPDLRNGRCEIVRIHRPAAWCGDLRGGSQLVALDGSEGIAYLALVHGVLEETPRRLYFHALIGFDRRLTLRGLSLPFLLRDRQVEFAAGLVADGDDLVVTWGESDNEAWMGRMSISDALDLCEPIG
ncbi:MAG: hypothetical protein ACREMK_06590 [Gemmatimonadota bacterium]